MAIPLLAAACMPVSMEVEIGVTRGEGPAERTLLAQRTATEERLHRLQEQVRNQVPGVTEEELQALYIRGSETELKSWTGAAKTRQVSVFVGLMHRGTGDHVREILSLCGRLVEKEVTGTVPTESARPASSCGVLASCSGGGRTWNSHGSAGEIGFFLPQAGWSYRNSFILKHGSPPGGSALLIIGTRALLRPYEIQRRHLADQARHRWISNLNPFANGRMTPSFILSVRGSGAIAIAMALLILWALLLG